MSVQGWITALVVAGTALSVAYQAKSETVAEIVPVVEDSLFDSLGSSICWAMDAAVKTIARSKIEGRSESEALGLAIADLDRRIGYLPQVFGEVAYLVNFISEDIWALEGVELRAAAVNDNCE